MNRQDENNQYQNNYSRNNIFYLDKIEDILLLRNPDDMDNKINKNMENVNNIFYSFLKKVSYDGNIFSKEEIDNFIYALKFVDTLNLFIQNQTLKILLDYMKSIYDNVKKLNNNFEYKELILKKIKYTEMTVIFYKKRIFKNLYFGDGRVLGKEIENKLEYVTRGGKFDQIIFKQMQNLFYVVQGRIEESKRVELQNKFADMKALSIKYKKQRANINQGNYFEDYSNDYSDYKNYSNIGNNLLDYNKYFYDNRNYYEEDYNNNYYKDSSRRFHQRHSYRNNTYNNSNYYIKKYCESDEKEIEIPGEYKNNLIENEENINEIYDTKNDNIEVVQNVIGNQGKGNYYNDYNRRRSFNNIQNIPQNINNNYNNNYRKNKKIQKQRGITLVEVPLPNSVIQNEENEIKESINNEKNNNEENNNNNNNNKEIENNNNKESENYNNNNVNNKEVEYEEENNYEKYQNKYYHNSNSNYKQNTYNKGYYNNYHHGRDNYYHNNYYNSQGNNQSGNNSDSNSYYNNRRNKQFYQNKQKRDFIEVDNLNKNKHSFDIKENDIPVKTLSFNSASNEQNIDYKENKNEINEMENNNKKEDNNNIKDEKENNKNDGKIINNEQINQNENIDNKNKEINKNNNNEKIENKEIISENNIQTNSENLDNEIEQISKPIPIEKINFNRNFLTPSPDKFSNPLFNEQMNLYDNNENMHNQIDEEESLENENEESEDSNINEDEINRQFNQFISENFVGNNKENYYLETNKKNKIEYDDNENIYDEDLINEINEKEIEDEIQEEIIKNVINEDEEQESFEEKIEEFIKEKIDLDSIIHLAQKEIIDEEEIKLNNKKDNNNNINNNNSGNIYTNTTKEVDTKLVGGMKNKLNEIIPNYIYYHTGFPHGNTSMFEKNFIQKIINYKQMSNNNIPLSNYVMSNMQFLIRGRDAVLIREYLTLKIEEFENPKIIWNNLNNFENKIIIPLYQRINYNVNKKRRIYDYTFNKYSQIIQKVLLKDKILKKVKPYGSYMNNFLIDSGDIDICIVPNCEILEFSQYLEKIKEEIISKKIAEHKLTHHTGGYLLLKLIDNETKFIIDITVHTMLPILNTNLIRLYSLFDQRFHILGLYIKHWAKINKIHGAPDNYLSSYALLLMLIHFLQKIVEPRVLPNLQKVDITQENIYEYNYNGECIKTNIYYEEDLNKIKDFMNKINKGQENKESSVNLLVKFFEYYSYYFNSEQKISINKDLNESIKSNSDNIPFSIEDPFDKYHNPGKSMTNNSIQCIKFITAMKREINFILNGEYVKRLEKIYSNGNSMN